MGDLGSHPLEGIKQQQNIQIEQSNDRGERVAKWDGGKGLLTQPESPDFDQFYVRLQIRCENLDGPTSHGGNPRCAKTTNTTIN